MKNLLIVFAIATLAFVCSAQESSELTNIPWAKTNKNLGILPAISICVNPRMSNIDFLSNLIGSDMVCLFVPPETMRYNNGTVAFPSIDLPMPLPSIDITSLIVRPFFESDKYQQLVCTCVFPINPAGSDSSSEESSAVGDDSNSADTRFPLPSYDGSTQVPLQCTCKDSAYTNQTAAASQTNLPLVNLYDALPEVQDDLSKIGLNYVEDVDNLVPVNCECGWPFPKLINSLIQSQGTNQSWLMCRCNHALTDGSATAVIPGTSIVFPVTNATWTGLDLSVPALDVLNVQGATADVVFPYWSAFLPIANATLYGGEVLEVPPFFNVTSQ